MTHPTRSRMLPRGVAIVAAAATALFGAVVPTAAHAAIDAAPLIHYTFDSAATAGSVADVSGNGYDATVRRTGATFDNGTISLPGGSSSAAPYLEIPTAGLVGKVTAPVEADRARIMLITDSRYSVDVKIVPQAPPPTTTTTTTTTTAPRPVGATTTTTTGASSAPEPASTTTTTSSSVPARPTTRRS